MMSRFAAVAMLCFFSVTSLLSTDSQWSAASRLLAAESDSGDADRDAAGKEDRTSATPASVSTETTEPDSKPAAELTDGEEKQPEAAQKKTSRRSARGKQFERETLPTTDAGWRRVLSVPQYQVLRRHATEPAFSGRYWNTKLKGVYRCAGCGLPLFSSATKFKSGTGWPSYWAAYNDDCIGTQIENTPVPRMEVHCKKCGGHLGHVFSDGPAPTGLRFCINSVSLVLDRDLPPVPEPKSKAADESSDGAAADQP